MTSARCAAWVIATSAEAVDARSPGDEVAYVLHRYPYGETSLLVDLFACCGGRLRVVARGARRNRVGQLFTELAVAWSGRRPLKTLVRAEPLPASPPLDGRALYLGFYLNELLLRLLPEGDPHPRLYQRYRALLATLATDAEPEPLLRRFELRLLEELGYGLVLDHTADGDPVRNDADYRFVPGTGLIVAGAHPIGGGATLPGAHLLAIAVDDYRDPAVRRGAKRLLRAALAEHLGARPLRSRALFRDLGGELGAGE